ncbi:hypothetical protein BJ138DRAFT_100352 [Hygrophoropsis aurantiaca]|uniref:Uncharacterized protein n=1 Tax=Hygrophoropsis aurantiaca TaxID=72124 RepID=A0ACB7ZSN3_9AGAM|nr:hypothetical protein BJ138DRAFT_100352 [Hygrophoropsis aurantiaca]
MHPALLIQDIQYCILDQILSKKTINAFARSCKAFTETALDTQWRDLDSFTRLIECMPHDLWNRDIICSRLDGIDEHTFVSNQWSSYTRL